MEDDKMNEKMINPEMTVDTVQPNEIKDEKQNEEKIVSEKKKLKEKVKKEKKPKKNDDKKKVKKPKKVHKEQIEEAEMLDVFQDEPSHSKRSTLQEEVIRAERAIVPQLNEEKVVKLPKGTSNIDIPEFHKINEIQEESKNDNIEQNKENSCAIEEDENTDDDIYFQLHADMESKERLRFIKIVQSLAPRHKGRTNTICDKYYSMTRPEELLPSYHSVPILVEPIKYMESYGYNHCTNHVQPGIEKYIYPPAIPKLKGNWLIDKEKSGSSSLFISKYN
ncbi:hypothetical protein EHI8A_235380 [Entamoeba histolytica HM-1:IMSS-B]|uniref:Uncharacterized protein n=6 Tax=Entamoeba histolytica TaxID=5759 RepID=C4M0Y1_ENTH1|nr:hypothetical protein EHI_015450 [Entamoeba histolytica HM-1:IMSS]EMD45723.1 Hypothetical protein EHI5A_244580 [Entamoeba histolytica KU27]EMH74607.1 hypothetical protein EHI8A_235380 [Entamoeba histolytica HM-1:IMSS-B]EMS15803.1 hypothetical protein KM1_300030 [Entamoeba histolytica HM-3:IMSS]ENY62877.1 hypothetical protein EHI7A_198740 [Entamoeba histolytica HM-1:IMSS-A]GAT94837.1 hypothetical protein CL6EHI_015450 [Entamoeba histolytica]|eukprot:XP_654489.1 hypothetical protein EHI_015450 [Entamoeba histolytica HM-1:IMSS]